MEFRDVLRRRRMIRSYQEGRQVPADALDAILVAALRAPSAGFTQGVSLLVLASAEERETFWQVAAEADTPWLRGMGTAPVLVLVWTSEEAYLDRYAEPDKGWTDRDPARWSAPYWFVDAGMASMAVLLSAVDHRLGACFFGIPVDRIAAVREAFGVPASQLSVGVVSVGYPAMAPEMRPEPVEGRAWRGPGPITGSPTRRPRKPLSESIHRGTWS
ncbi:MAG TPA: nitroreductase family protein [Propionibacteriaceae bacterium]|jgi:nitroreductase|nr:nitroreductase family protein [Propionibacteriaceae bacterium]